MKKAVTVVDEALRSFERESGLTPRVVLLPRRVFNEFVRESNILASVLPVDRNPKDPREWADVRVVEHEQIESIEVY